MIDHCDRIDWYREFRKALNSHNIELLTIRIKQFFNEFPLTRGGSRERVFHAALEAAFRVFSEQWCNNGRLDLAVETYRHIYVFEFKTDDAVNFRDGLPQMFRGSYSTPFADTSKSITFLALTFSPASRMMNSQAIINVREVTDLSTTCSPSH